MARAARSGPYRAGVDRLDVGGRGVGERPRGRRPVGRVGDTERATERRRLGEVERLSLIGVDALGPDRVVEQELAEVALGLRGVEPTGIRCGRRWYRDVLVHRRDLQLGDAAGNLTIDEAAHAYRAVRIDVGARVRPAASVTRRVVSARSEHTRRSQKDDHPQVVTNPVSDLHEPLPGPRTHSQASRGTRSAACCYAGKRRLRACSSGPRKKAQLLAMGAGTDPSGVATAPPGGRWRFVLGSSAMRTAASCIVVAMLLALAGPRSAGADTRYREARRHVARANRDYDRGDYRDALARYQRAYKLVSNPDIVVAIGKCHAALHEWDRAVESFSEYLQRVERSSDRGGVQKLLAHAKTEAARARRPERRDEDEDEGEGED